MKIHQVDKQTFEAKKFRLPIEYGIYDRIGTNLSNIRIIGTHVREYSNPQAENIYRQIQQTQNPKEKVELYEQMGDYKIKKASVTERLKLILRKFIMDELF